MSNLPRKVFVCAVAFALVATACSSGPTTEVKAKAQPRTIAHPLTGVEYSGPQPWMSRPVLAVKIGNAPPERPQAGLDKADLVYEEIVEGGTTRFMAVFSTNDAQRVGPVRSARKVDPTLLAPLHALFGYSGGAPSTIRVIRSSSGFTDVGVDRASGAYHRDRSRNMPYNLYTSTSELWSEGSGSAPAAQFKFLKESSDPTAGSTETAADISFAFGGNGSSRVRYVYNSDVGRYEREQNGSHHAVEGSGPLSYRNVVIQMVKLSAGYSIDKAGYRTHDIATTGSGEAVIFRGGKAFRGTWQRSSSSEPTRFLTATGRPIALVPGNTIVELLPQGQPISIAKPAA